MQENIFISHNMQENILISHNMLGIRNTDSHNMPWYSYIEISHNMLGNIYCRFAQHAMEYRDLEQLARE